MLLINKQFFSLCIHIVANANDHYIKIQILVI